VHARDFDRSGRWDSVCDGTGYQMSQPQAEVGAQLTAPSLSEEMGNLKIASIAWQALPSAIVA